MTMKERRASTRAELDALSDFVTGPCSIGFRREFRAMASGETYCMVSNLVIERAQSLLTEPLVDSVAKTVHDRVFFEIGSNNIPMFSLVEGGRERTLFTFRCVYDLCSASLQVRLFSGVYVVKWVMMGVSHVTTSHHFRRECHAGLSLSRRLIGSRRWSSRTSRAQRSSCRTTFSVGNTSSKMQ